MSDPIEDFRLHMVNAQSMGANVTSDLVTLDTVSVFCVQNSWTGTPTGTLYLEARNDESMPWTTVHSSSLTGSTGDEMINVDVAGYYQVQVRYARSSGTGTLNSFINGKKRS